MEKIICYLKEGVDVRSYMKKLLATDEITTVVNAALQNKKPVNTVQQKVNVIADEMYNAAVSNETRVRNWVRQLRLLI